MTSEQSGPVLPWWRVRMVWLVISGPAIVVVAGFVTLAIAIRFGDPPLRAVAGATDADTRTPATQARNHAATPRR